MTGPIDHSPFAPAPLGRGGGIWGPEFVWVTVGSVALIFLAAIQSLAVTTVMPVVSADLDGASLYVPHPMQNRTTAELHRFAEEVFGEVVATLGDSSRS